MKEHWENFCINPKGKRNVEQIADAVKQSECRRKSEVIKERLDLARELGITLEELGELGL